MRKNSLCFHNKIRQTLGRSCGLMEVAGADPGEGTQHAESHHTCRKLWTYGGGQS